MNMKERMAQSLAHTIAQALVQRGNITIAEIVDDALGSLLNPTEEMIKAGSDAMPFAGPTTQIWEAMIWAAKEGR